MQFECKKCVMDRTAEEIVFTETGCNFCDTAVRIDEIRKADMKNLPDIYAKIRKEGKGKPYDVLLGLSGGVDSAWCLHKLVQNGIRPLCFSVDNGWNDPRADENIMRLVEGMKVPFFKYTIDLKRFKRLQSAFLLAGQKNIEIPTDHILLATTYEMASKYGIRYIISGGNHATESIMPASWGYQPRDLVHIKDVYEREMGEYLTGLPTLGLWKWNYYKWIKGIETINLLDFYTYDREGAIDILEKEYGYKTYGEKHNESIYTKWHINWYLYEKFGIDKRKAHLSSLIMSGQISRKEAKEVLLTNPIYPQLGIEERVMGYKIKPYTDYATDEYIFNFISKCIKACRFLKQKMTFTRA